MIKYMYYSNFHTKLFQIKSVHGLKFSLSGLGTEIITKSILHSWLPHCHGRQLLEKYSCERSTESYGYTVVHGGKKMD